MSARSAALPVAAVVVVATLLGVQLSMGGGRYEPSRPTPPCQERPVEPRSEDVDGLTESLVLTGLAAAACDLGVGREQLVLEIARQGAADDEQVEALRAGLLSAIDRLQAAGALPPASALRDEAVAGSDLSPFVRAAIGLVPDGVIDAALPTDEVLTRAVESLDVRALLADLGDQQDVEDAVERAVTAAVRDTLVDRVRGLLP